VLFYKFLSILARILDGLRSAGLPILAAILHGVAYVMYMFLVYDGDSVPNPATWTVSAFLASLNAITFAKGSKDLMAAAQFVVGSVGAIAVWCIALYAGTFAPLDSLSQTMLVLCFLVIVVWKVTGFATYGNVVIALTVVAAIIPTIKGVWDDPSSETVLPWALWTFAFLATICNVVRRKEEEHEVDWRLMLITPVTLLFAHAAVAGLAARTL